MAGILGKSGYVRDNVLADLAKLNGPSSLAFDSAGNYFIADTRNNRIRRVDIVTKEITTYAGQKKSGSSGDGGLATDAMIIGPWGLAMGPDDHLYFTEAYANTVRRVDAATTIITRVAGVTWSNGYNGDGVDATLSWLYFPHGVCVTDDNDLIISDSQNNLIRRRVDGSTGLHIIAGTLIAGFSGDNGPGTSAQLNFPEKVNLGIPSLERVPELCR